MSEDPHELRDRDFEGNEELVLVQVHEVGLGGSLHDDGNPVRVFLDDLTGLLLPLFCCSRVGQMPASGKREKDCSPSV